MISVGLDRFSKKRPCRICGKPTYCGFSKDEGTSICMRISAGSRGLSRNGGNIHVHSEIPLNHLLLARIMSNKRDARRCVLNLMVHDRAGHKETRS